MKKELSEMTLEELWALFPIYLAEHQTCWNAWYDHELIDLKEQMPVKDLVRISHIGSTAIDTICAKPIVDILIEVNESCQLTKMRSYIEQCGYLLMSSSQERMSFNKGYTSEGFAEKVFHLHLRYEGDNDELYFRDYLNDHSDIAKKYEQLKLELWKQYEYDRDGYTEAKTDFVKRYTEKAKRIYGRRWGR